MGGIQTDFSRVTYQAVSGEDFHTRQVGARGERSLLKPKILHRNWDVVKARIDDTFDQYIFHIPSQYPRGVVVFITGCESSPLLFPEQIKKLASVGFEIVGIPLKNLRHEGEEHKTRSEIDEENTSFVERILFDNNAIINSQRFKDLPITILTHSEGGQKAFQALMVGDNAKNALEREIPFTDTNLYIGPAGASEIPKEMEARWIDRVKMQAAAKFYALYVKIWAKDRELGSLLLDRFVTRAKLDGLKEAFAYAVSYSTLKKYSVKAAKALIGKLSGTFSKEVTKPEDSVFVHSESFPAPQHYHALALKYSGRKLLEEASKLKQENPEHPVFLIKRTIYSSKNDPASSHTLNQYASGIFNAEFVSCGGEHVALHEDADMFQTLINNLNKHALDEALRDLPPLLPEEEVQSDHKVIDRLRKITGAVTAFVTPPAREHAL